ncbi:MAG: phosphoglycerate kinase [Candidatus Peregrinibacteria bacterium]|nr:phosphoglycerate kinase [Candidatus Peregrinibacteria bacterium]MDZ4245092.1 phosphoglycerate kinase [Candidatus Gracilibacteria bacterium]
MALKTLKDVDLKFKRVLLRVDFNVPLDKETGEIQDNTRIVAAMNTIYDILDGGVTELVIMTHLGRPKGEKVPTLSTKVLAEELSNIMGEEVLHVSDCVGIPCKSQDHRVFMLENVRFHPEEKKGDEGFAKKLAEHGDVFINDAFAVCHRDEASVTTVAKVMQAEGKAIAAGRLVEKEAEMLGKILENPKAPFVMIVSGAKVDTKIGMIQNFYDKVDTFILGGGIANTFLAAEGFDVADSLYEEDKVELAREILVACSEHVNEVVIPTDAMVASEFSATAEAAHVPVEDVMGDMRILDLGSNTIDRCVEILSNAEMIVWNGPLGVYEFPQFMEGTKRIAEAIAANKNATTVIGGGDTVDAVNKLGISFKEYTHVSTGGGAMVEFLEGKVLPGIEVLMD